MSSRQPRALSEWECKARRTTVLRRLLGDESLDETLAASLIHEDEAPHSASEVDTAGISRGPFIDLVNAGIVVRLGVNLETALRRRVLPGYCALDEGGHEFRFPVWLAQDTDVKRSDRFGRRREPLPKDPLCLRLDREDRLVSVTGGWSRRQLMRACFSPRPPSEWRRYLIGSTVEFVLSDFEEIFRVEPPDWAWLRRMRLDPVAVEREACALWERFLEHVPMVLRIPGVELGVTEFKVLCEGPDGGRDRRWFAKEWPAAALFLLQRGAVKRAFGQVERNRANAKKVAAATLCCAAAGRRGQRPCERALFTAGRLPRFKDDLELVELFRDEGRFSHKSTQVRALFMHLNHEIRGDLLRRLGSNSRFVRSQVEFAIRVGMSPLVFTPYCRLEIAKFVVRILAGTGVDPTTWSEVGVEAGDVAQALATVSADALASFAVRRLEVGDYLLAGETEMSSPFETGVLALLLHLQCGGGKPPTPRQLCEFSRRAPRLANHRIETLHDTGLVATHEWPAPPGWREGLVAGLASATATPMTSIAALRACGKRLRNCLRDNTDFDLKAVLGRLVMFSIRADEHEALLSLRAVERNDESNGVWVERYERDDCKGFGNGEPYRGCMEAAQRLTDGLNEALPRSLDPAEVERRRSMRARTLDQRTYNKDMTVAGLWWKEAATRCLPPRFTKQDPAEIVDAYLSRMR